MNDELYQIFHYPQKAMPFLPKTIASGWRGRPESSALEIGKMNRKHLKIEKICKNVFAFPPEIKNRISWRCHCQIVIIIELLKKCLLPSASHEIFTYVFAVKHWLL